MAFSVVQTTIPQHSVISKSAVDAYFFDSYSFSTQYQGHNALGIWLAHAASTPKWVNFLMTCRNAIVSRMGLKHLGQLGDFEAKKLTDEYQVGDSVGIFTLVHLTDNEIILSDSDKHLDVQVSVYKVDIESNLISISTVVHVHNIFGKIYMLLVKPMHKMIVPSSIKRAESVKIRTIE